MTDLNKGSEVNLRFEQDDGAVWVFVDDSQFGTEISHLMMMHVDEYSENELRVICHHAACEIDRLRAELEKAKAQAVQQSFEIGRLQDRITELLDERQDLYAQINNDQAVPEGYVLVPVELYNFQANRLAEEEFKQNEKLFNMEHRGLSGTEVELRKLKWLQCKAESIKENYRRLVKWASESGAEG
ncbi:hypothetical protein ACT400_12935 [Acinetobacter baumannii]